MRSLVELQTEILQSGFFPDLEAIASPLWRSLSNVYPGNRGLKALPGASLAYAFPEEITGLAQAFVSNIPRVYVGGRTKAWYFTPNTAVEICNGLTDTKRTRIETFGAWAFINNGSDRVRLWKNTGLAEGAGTLPYTYVKHVKRFFTHLLVANTNTDPNILAWCSSDNPEDWNFANPENSAGELFVRDLDGPIGAFCGLGQSVAMYANETMVLVNYLGNAFVMGATPSLRGIGVWGGESVCELSDKNYGFGPQGLFVTNGGSFQMLDDDRVKNYIKESIDLAARETALTYHNEELGLIEFVYTDLAGARRRLGFHYASNTFWPFDKELGRAIERQVFAFPVGSKGQNLLYLNNGTSWNGEVISGHAETKPLDAGDDVRAKTINMIQLGGKWTGLTLTLKMQEDQDNVSWTPLNAAAAVRQNWVEAEGFYFRLRFDFLNSTSNFTLTDIKIFGVPTGRAG